MTCHIYIVDVFAEQLYTGNPLAVVIGTFVSPSPEQDGGYRVRIYTPSKELAFAGHPILGTAQVLRDQVIADECSQLKLNLMQSQVTVTFENSDEGKEVVWFLAPDMSLGAIADIEPVAKALGISTENIDSKIPIQMVSAGTAAIMVPLRSLEALQKCMLNLEKYSSMLADGFPPLIYLFTQDTYHSQNDLCARFFFEAHGVREDPATGNGAAFLGAYLLEHNYFSTSDLNLRIEQGYEIRRPSLVRLRANMKNGRREVYVGGQVLSTVEGKLL
jgi:trans-2,3-dihydro-3-hydroxyanthranilate isomerase